MNILEYIDLNLPKTVAYTPQDAGDLIGLAYPYIMPCAFTGFRAMFYWDTYFIHKGLLVRGELEQVKNDIDNMMQCFEATLDAIPLISDGKTDMAMSKCNGLKPKAKADINE